jgi:hypothetical protein
MTRPANARRYKRKPEERPAPLPGALSYTLPDAGRLSGLHPATLRRRAAEGALRLFRCGGRTLVDGNSLRRMLGAETSK